MRIYLLYDKSGKITEMADAGYGFEFNEKEIKLNHPDKEIMEIDEKDYKKLEGKLEYFKIENNKIIPLEKLERDLLDKEKEIWRKNHSIEGLNEKVEKLNKKIKELESKIK